jgi:hypothetical protein
VHAAHRCARTHSGKGRGKFSFARFAAKYHLSPPVAAAFFEAKVQRARALGMGRRHLTRACRSSGAVGRVGPRRACAAQVKTARALDPADRMRSNLYSVDARSIKSRASTMEMGMQ